jgi:hypothetical protein
LKRLLIRKGARGKPRFPPTSSPYTWSEEDDSGSRR